MSEKAPPTASRAPVAALAAGGLLTGAMVLLLNARRLPLGVPGQWEWARREELLLPAVGTLAGVLAFAAATAGVVLALRPGRAASRAATVAVVVLCMVAAGVTMVGLPLDSPLAPLELATVTASSQAVGYFSYTTAIEDLALALGGYSGRTEGIAPMPGRLITHPPGPLLAFYLGQRGLELWGDPVAWTLLHLDRAYGLTALDLHRAARYQIMPTVTAAHMPQALILGLLISLWGALLPLPAYFLGRFLGGREHGLIAALLCATLPSLLAFVPSIDGVAALLGLGVLAVWAWALRRDAWPAYALAGLTMAAAVYWTVGLVGLAGIMLAMALGGKRGSGASTAASVRRVLPGLLTAAGAFLAVYLLVYAIFDYNLLINLKLIARSQRSEIKVGYRQYLPWLPMNLYDFLLFMGPALAALAIAACGRLRRAPTPVRAFGWGSLAVFAALWLSGSTLGEVGRIWLFMMPPFAVLAAGLLTSAPPALRGRLVALLVVCQVVATVYLHHMLYLVRA